MENTIIPSNKVAYKYFSQILLFKKVSFLHQVVQRTGTVGPSYQDVSNVYYLYDIAVTK